MNENDSKPQKKQFSLLPKVINGSIAGLVAHTATYPLDLVKTRLQNQQFRAGVQFQYKSMLDGLIKIYKNEGFLRMFKGSSVVILLITPEKAIKLATNDIFRYYLMQEDGSVSAISSGIAGFLAAALQVVVTTPLDLIKIQLQDAGRLEEEAKAEGRTIKHLTAREVARNLYRENGWRGFYRGFIPVFWKMTGFTTFYFPLFYVLNELGPRKSNESGTYISIKKVDMLLLMALLTIQGEAVFYWSFVSGFIAGATLAILMTPVDVVQTRLQLIQKGKHERSYNGVADAFINIFKHEGILAFYKGTSCRIVVVGSITAVMQMVYFLGVAEYFMGIEHYKV